MTTYYAIPSDPPSFEGVITEVDRTRPGRPLFVVTLLDSRTGSNVEVEAMASIEEFYANNINHLDVGTNVVVESIEQQMWITRVLANRDDFETVIDLGFGGDPIILPKEPPATITVAGTTPSTTTVSGEGVRIDKDDSHVSITGDRTEMYYETETSTTEEVPDPENPGETITRVTINNRDYYFRVDASGIRFHSVKSGVVTLGAGAAQGEEGALVITDPTLEFDNDNFRFVLVPFAGTLHLPVYRVDADGNPTTELIGMAEFGENSGIEFSDKILANRSAILTTSQLAAAGLVPPPNDLRLSIVTRELARVGRFDASVDRLEYSWLQPSLPANADISNTKYNVRIFGYGLETSDLSTLFAEANKIQFNINTTRGREIISTLQSHSGTIAQRQSYDTALPITRNELIFAGAVLSVLAYPALILVATAGAALAAAGAVGSLVASGTYAAISAGVFTAIYMGVSTRNIVELSYDGNSNNWRAIVDYNAILTEGGAALYDTSTDPATLVNIIRPDMFEFLLISGFQAQTSVSGFENSPWSEPVLAINLKPNEGYEWRDRMLA